MLNKNEARINAIIENAEISTNPVDILLSEVGADPGAPFKPENLKLLKSLKAENLAIYENVRAKLKDEGVRVSELDKALAEDKVGALKPTQAQKLIALTEGMTLFHDPDNTGYAEIQIDGHTEIWPIRSSKFKEFLAKKYYELCQGAPSSEASNSAINVIHANAVFGGEKKDVYLRVANFEEKIFFDLCNAEWQAVEISRDGWRIMEVAPVKFRRSKGMAPLSLPQSGGDINLLRKFLNVGCEEHFILVVAWLLAGIRGQGSLPILAINGEQGSAKSTCARILRTLLDPSTVPLRTLSSDEQSLVIAANNSYIQAYDNISSLPPWLSDALCKLATGGGLTKRKLFEDTDEILLDVKRPVLLNGIESFVSRPDLADRTLAISLLPIPDEHRRTEEELWCSFDAVAPQILGALLDAAVQGLRRLKEIKMESLPRLADFARWVTACEEKFWPPGTFIRAFNANKNEMVEKVLSEDGVALEIIKLLEGKSEWVGTATQLLQEITQSNAKNSLFPKNPRAMSGVLERLAPFLRRYNIEIDRYKEGKAKTRLIRILRKPDYTTITASAPSAHDQFSEKTVDPDGADDENSHFLSNSTWEKEI
ncbi:MAG: hypothetical protein EYC62_06450 [Alphaproteobacteria bacterium]|nr:MAG: hypothetical protein EYC62_06450 [Alphaproteobacteria bacterium]